MGSGLFRVTWILIWIQIKKTGAVSDLTKNGPDLQHWFKQGVGAEKTERRHEGVCKEGFLLMCVWRGSRSRVHLYKCTPLSLNFLPGRLYRPCLPENSRFPCPQNWQKVSQLRKWRFPEWFVTANGDLADSGDNFADSVKRFQTNSELARGQVSAVGQMISYSGTSPLPHA